MISMASREGIDLARKIAREAAGNSESVKTLQEPALETDRNEGISVKDM